MCCNPFRWCLGGKRKRKKHARKMSISNANAMGLQYGAKNMIITDGLERDARICTMPSTPSRVKTADLTFVYTLPSNEYHTVEEIVAAQGFQISSELIGKGATATVYKARRLRDSRPCACKIMDITTPKAAKTAKNELFIMERVSHPHVIKLYKHFIVEMAQIRQVYIFMQLAGESLNNYMQARETGLPEDMCRKMFAQIVSAVAHMHRKNVAHRDLKCSNCLLDENYNCLVGDFGLSRVSRKRTGELIKMAKYAGTLSYMAPEILLTKETPGGETGSEAAMQYDPFMVDLFALGVILFYLIYRIYPFNTGESLLEEQLASQIKFADKARRVFEPSPELISLIKKLLEPTVENRMTMDALVVHPWIAKEVARVEQTLKERYKPKSLSMGNKTSVSTSEKTNKEQAAMVTSLASSSPASSSQAPKTTRKYGDTTTTSPISPTQFAPKGPNCF